MVAATCAPSDAPNGPIWQCLPQAYATILGLSLDDFLAGIGHDGSEVVFPGQPDPYGRRAFHVEECARVALYYGRASVLFSLNRVSINQFGETYVSDGAQTIANVMRAHDCILLGKSPGRRPHAAAMVRGKVLDRAVNVATFNIDAVIALIPCGPVSV